MSQSVINLAKISPALKAVFMQRCRKPPQRKKIHSPYYHALNYRKQTEEKYPQVYRDSGFCGM